MNKPLLLALAGLFAVAGCSAERVSNFPSYKLTVIQGNELDPRAVVSLQPGMSRDQVQLLLGTPLLRDPFHANRWDYTFNIARNGVVEDLRVLTVYFDNDRLVRAEGNAIEHAIQQLEAARPQAEQQAAAPQPAAPSLQGSRRMAAAVVGSGKAIR